MRELTELEKWAVDMDETLLVDRLAQLREAVERRDGKECRAVRGECRGYLAALFWRDVTTESGYRCYLEDIDLISGEVRHA